jgi:predicted transposase YbfD/YdcC
MEMVPHSLYNYLSQIPDFRRTKSRRHPLTAVLSMLIMATLSGQVGLRSMARFVLRHQSAFSAFFGLRHGVPCYATLRTILRGVSFEELNTALFNWTHYHYPLESEEWQSLDGKALNSTITDSQDSNQQYLSLINLYGHKHGLIYSSEKMDSKKANEPEIVRQFLEHLASAAGIPLDSLNTRLDALHCQKKNTTMDWNSSIIGLKSNCSALLSAAQAMMVTNPTDAVTSTDARKITRTTEVFSVKPDELPADWGSVKAVLRVHRKGIRYAKKSRNRKKKKKKQAATPSTPVAANPRDCTLPLPLPSHEVGNRSEVASAKAGNDPTQSENQCTLPKGIPFEETAYYICIGEIPSAETAAKAVQEHWGIENKIHRNKDVTFNEDKNKIKNKSIAANLSQIFNFSLNLFTCLGIKSLKHGIEMYAHDTKFLLAALNSIHLYIQ